MSVNDVKKVADRIITVAKTAAAASAVRFGTVLSRNPDGSRNVDDGQGGCARVMPAGNYRVGEKVPIGTEPALGSTTSLTPEYFPIASAMDSCPTDPRDIPSTPLTQAGFYGITMTAQVTSWSDRLSVWPTVARPANGTSVSPAVNSTIGTDWRTDFDLGHTPPAGLYYYCHRNFLQFPRPPGAFTALSLEFSFDGNPANDNTQFGARWAPDNDSMIVVPATPATWPPTAPDWTSAQIGVTLGRRLIMATTVFGQTNYGISIPLDVAALIASGAMTSTTITLCIISAYDQSGATPPGNTIFPSAHGSGLGPDGYANGRSNYLHGYVPPAIPTPTASQFPRLVGSISEL